MLLTKQYFELLDDIVNWWNSDSIDFDKAKLDIIINIIKDKQTQLYGVDGQGGLYGNYLDNKFALSDTLTKLRKQSKYQFDFDYEGFRKSRLDNIALKEMYKQQQFILERYADLYAVTMVKRSKMKRAELLKIGVLQKFKDFAIGNFVLESPKNRKNYRVGGTNAYEAVFSQYSQRSLYNKLLNPEEAKTGYDIFKYFVNQSTFLGDWEKVKDSGVLDYFGAISRGNIFETIIINQLAQINPGKIAITDLNYIARDNPFLTGRFDALELDFNNKVTKIIEIKTTNTPQTFFPHPSDTIQKTKRVLENIPLDYTHQLLYYMKMANVLEGQIVALTNIFDLTKKDNAYNIAKFDIDNKNTISKLGRVRFSQPKKIIDLYATCYYPKLYEFTCFLKSNLSKKVSHIPSGRFSPKNSEAKVEDLKLELNDIFRSGKINKIVAIDIETDRDRIIEFGAIVSDLSGNILCEVGQLVDGKNESSLFGVPEFWPFINYGELEYEGLHNITPVLIANKPLFEYSDKLKEIVNLLFQPNQILLYHNASMENGKFSLWIPDYFVRLKKGTIRVVDSLNYSKYLDNVKKDEIKNSQTNSIVDIYQNDTLDSYAKRWGVKPNSETGDELHRGHDDARIMLEVFLKHSGEILKDI